VDRDHRELAMFPLGQTLVPGMLLPLHVFEPRYRALMEHLTEHESSDAPELGVILIERGSEVGGGDVRSDIGVVARLVRAERFDDGRWGVVCVAERRCRVIEWLPDDPWPRAQVVEVPEAPVTDPQVIAEELTALAAELRRVLALAAELGDPVASPTIDLVDDPVIASYQLSALAPVGPLDRQQLLACEGPTTRLALLRALLTEQAELLAFRLGAGDGDPPDPPT
jgi:uncharacterized protein